ncbi:KinB-signaling pathway activation protein [Paenibacillus sp. 481]|uniref:KinB-signaling pathway activation protein n=1 Tax=Paenibacillus sp. 481 TaxID=2835869 RepID=UPI001E2FA046|nr:KinB-signaling pathway activation protein [Paenibacillus sp. 481]UHA71741.1 KinB-signaling pathway activation protein [Paenibacillus sp. 481]
MNLKKWSFLFWTTSLIGGAVMLLTGLSLQVIQGEWSNFKGPWDIVINVFMLLLSGLLISVFSQMGLFAYLTLNYIAIGLFKKVWPYIQVFLTVVVLLDIMFLRSWLGTVSDSTSDILLGIVLTGIGIIVAFFKVKGTNVSGLIPTLFFMITVTAIQILFALNISKVATWFVVIPLVACNAYQILILHRVLKKD